MRELLGGNKQDTYDGTPPVSVSDLNHLIADMMASEPTLSDISVIGEVSDLKRYDSGHWYFNLKDSLSQIKAVMWRSSTVRQMASGFVPENGMMVTARGDIRVYEANGIYQIVVRGMAPAGEGAKYAAFLKLRAKLSDEGLFDGLRKKPLPNFVQHVALVTSPSSAAARDFVKVAKQRWAGIRITIIPAIMQGASSPDSVIEALAAADAMDDADVIAIVRGGGSTEDLWCFNDENLARTIAAVRRPVVAGIGHEIDTTIADLVADLRASTPSNAAELTVPDAAAVSSAVASLARRIGNSAENAIRSCRARFDGLVAGGPFARPMDMIDMRRQRLDGFSDILDGAMRELLGRASSRVRETEASLGALNPEAVLERGYSLCSLHDGRILREASQAGEGTELTVKLFRGKLGCTVKWSDQSGIK